MRLYEMASPLLLLTLLGSHACRTPARAVQPEPAPTRASLYLLWRAPGGFAGTGPAVEVQDNGIMHLWTSASGLQPHRAEDWDTERLLSPAQMRELYSLLAAVDFSALPHQDDIGLECYPVLYLELGGDSEEERQIRELRYQTTAQLRPEMDQVLAWFDDELRNLPMTAPSRYCVF